MVVLRCIWPKENIFFWYYVLNDFGKEPLSGKYAEINVLKKEEEGNIR